MKIRLTRSGLYLVWGNEDLIPRWAVAACGREWYKPKLVCFGGYYNAICWEIVK